MYTALLFAKLRTIPLLLAYVLFPLSNQVADLLGLELYRNWIDFAWLFLLLVAIVLRPLPHASTVPLRWRTAIFVLMLITMLLAVLSVSVHKLPAATVLMETKPVIYVFGTVLLLNRLGPPSGKVFAGYGATLGLLLFFEMIVRSILAGRLERPIGSGEVNYDAALLCLSLIFAIKNDRNAAIVPYLIWLGILASLSRTGIVAAVAIVVLAFETRIWLKMALASLGILAIAASFLTRGLEFDVLESMDRFWMWAAGWNYLTENWASTAIPSSLGAPVHIDLPATLTDLWLEQQDKLSVEGIFAFHFHAMWLRLALSWGWLPTSLVIVTLVAHILLSIRTRQTRQKAAFTVMTLVLGLTMGLIYLSNVGIVFFLAMFRHFDALRRVSFNVYALQRRPAAHDPIGVG